MDCPSCAKLLAAFEHAVSMYTTSVSEIKTLDQQSVRQACRERHEAWLTRGALMEHWHRDHDGAVGKIIPGNDFWLVSQRAEQLRRVCCNADEALIAHGTKSSATQKQALAASSGA